MKSIVNAESTTITKHVWKHEFDDPHKTKVTGQQTRLCYSTYCLRVNLLFKTSSNHKSFVEFYQCIEFIYSRVCWFFMCVVRLTMCHVMTDRVTSFTPIFSTISVIFVGCQLFSWH